MPNTDAATGKGFPLEGKLSAELTDEVSPTRISSCFAGKSAFGVLFENSKLDMGPPHPAFARHRQVSAGYARQINDLPSLVGLKPSLITAHLPLKGKASGSASLVSAQEHYDLLIAEGNDPVLDPPPLAAYMDGWDGDALFEALGLLPECRVLEIGVGTGRLALRALKKGCAAFTGMDLSGPTLEAAQKHLAAYKNVRLIRGEFPKDAPEGSFDRIYSSLTFMHIPDKEAAVRRIAALLAPGGRCVLSLDKERSDVLDMGTRQVRVYPDEPDKLLLLFGQAGLRPQPALETERAWLICADKPR